MELPQETARRAHNIAKRKAISDRLFSLVMLDSVHSRTIYTKLSGPGNYQYFSDY